MPGRIELHVIACFGYQRESTIVEPAVCTDAAGRPPTRVALLAIECGTRIARGRATLIERASSRPQRSSPWSTIVMPTGRAPAEASDSERLTSGAADAAEAARSARAPTSASVRNTSAPKIARRSAHRPTREGRLAAALPVL